MPLGTALDTWVGTSEQDNMGAVRVLIQPQSSGTANISIGDDAGLKEPEAKKMRNDAAGSQGYPSSFGENEENEAQAASAGAASTPPFSASEVQLPPTAQVPPQVSGGSDGSLKSLSCTRSPVTKGTFSWGR